MDFLDELESMALNVSDTTDDIKVSDADIDRWQRLFGFSRLEATEAIEAYRNDFTRIRIPDDLWGTVMSVKQAAGFDRESYEYSLTLTRRWGGEGNAKQTAMTATTTTASSKSGTFIVQLASPLDSPEAIQQATQLNHPPHLTVGVGEDGQARFCEIDAQAKARLLAWVEEHHSGFRPTIVRLAKAKKDLCSHSQAPTLGVDSSLPQHRALADDFTPLPRQDQYPVWYFFYGTLADPQILTQHLGLDEKPSFQPAHVCGGQIRSWAGKYRALVDAPMESRAFGSAFLVSSREQEDALRFYETDKYAVVRCRIITENDTVAGLTFRFTGTERDLD